MTADPVLVLAWLLLAHLVADFVIQTDQIATDKFAEGRRAWRGLGLHVAGVAVCLVPFALAFGAPGLELLVVIAAAHGVIDRVKVVATRGVEERAEAESRARHEGPAPDASLGVAWTPVPAALFALDQLAHVVVLVAAWAILLSQAPLTSDWVSATQNLFGRWDPLAVHTTITVGVVLVILAIVNIRAGSMFVAILVHPRQAVGALTEEDEPGRTEPASPSSGAVPTAGAASTAVNPATPPGAPDAPRGQPATSPPRAARPAAVQSPARVGATIGVLERLLIVTFVLTGAEAAIGFVVAAKTLARFKQLDDRQFAEYYLLGTLASVSVALGSGLIASAALAPLLGHP